MEKKKIIKKNQFVIPIGNGWAIKGEGNKQFTLITDNKREAVSIATDIAKRNESTLIIYNKNGEIVRSKNYSKKAMTVH
jgi:hypothetical protein